MTYYANLEKILALLPSRAANIIRSEIDKTDFPVSEIRLRADRPASLTVDNKNIILPLRCTDSEIRGTLLSLCDGSPYAYSETISRGYIPQKNGVRCTVCPTKGAGGSVDSISSICLRLPCEFDEPDNLYELCVDNQRIIPTLFYSPPGVGKTTILRFLIKRLSCSQNAFRASVIDSRRELYTRTSSADTLTDYLFGYEKGEGIELAVRSLSPQVIFCDEIGLKEDAESILAAENTGVPLIASAHADSLEALFKRPQIARLRDFGVFERYIGIKREKNKYEFDIYDITKK